jgi:hypothetical protein
VQIARSVAPAVAAGPRSLRVAVLCFVGAALCALTAQSGFQNIGLYLIVAAMAACVLVPLWNGWARDRLDWFEPVHVIGVLYLFYFGIGAIVAVHDPRSVYDAHIPPHVPRATLYCLFGYLAFLVGYYGPWFRSDVRPRFVNERPFGGLFVILVGIAGTVGYLSHALLQHTFRLGTSNVNVGVSSAAQLAPLFLLTWALCWQLYFDGSLERSHRIMLFGVLSPAVLYLIYATWGNKSLTMMLLGVPLIARWYIKRKMSWGVLLVLLLILVFIVFPLYNTYRWFEREAAHAERMSMAYETVADWDSTTYLENSVSGFLRRMAMINSVAIVVRDVGRWEPYALGETIFLPTINYFIPRVLWRDKPTSHEELKFGWRFRVTNFFTRNSYIAPSWPGELYWNFGLPGILVGMALLGVASRWLYRRYGSDGLGVIPRAIWVVMLLSLVFTIGTNVAASFAHLRLLLILELLRVVGRHYRLIVRDPAGATVDPSR